LPRAEDDQHHDQDDHQLRNSESHRSDSRQADPLPQGALRVTALIEPGRPRTSTLVYFLLLSIALHLLLLFWLRGAKLSVGDAEPRPIVVKLAPAPAEAPRPPQVAQAQQPAASLPANQVVAPSDQENNLPPDGRAFLSDRDNRVEQETIRKGNP